MIFKSRMLISILVLISIGFIVSAISSVQIAKELRLKRLTEQDLPLILDNAHSNIEKTLLKPEVIASMMASNSFLISWVEGDTKNIKQIRNYLSGIKKNTTYFNWANWYPGIFQLFFYQPDDEQVSQWYENS